MSDVVIIGAGNLGTSLGFALSRKGHRIVSISDKNLSSAQESQEIIGQGKFTEDNRAAAQSGHWIILTVPDDAIEAVVEELAGSEIEWQGRFVFHCSGLLSTESLKPLELKGARVASLHPVQSFPQKNSGPHAFKGIFFGLEGKGEALNLAIDITRQLGGKSIILEARNKPLYHTACSMASNFLVTLLDTATELLIEAGLDESTAPLVLFPLVQGTLQNVKKFDAGAALTGPVVRGDMRSVAEHLQGLDKQPDIRSLYLSLANRTLRIAKRKKSLSAEKIKALEALLAGK